jgi:hypothetical protein
MKIGIVTFHLANNYGAVLQSYALQRYLCELGYDAQLINFHFNFEPKHVGIRKFIGSNLTGTMYKLNLLVKSILFNKFRSKYIISTRLHYYSISDIRQNPPEADVYICGSDQIWNYNAIGERNIPVAWLDFGNKSTLRFAYAGSFGRDSLPDNIYIQYHKYAKQFTALSVRESSSLQLASNLKENANVEFVPDPIFLIASQAYSVLDQEIIMGDKNQFQYGYVFTYLLYSESEFKFASSVCKTLGLTEYSVDTHNCFRRVIREGFLTPGAWLKMLRNASMIVTHSFHAVAFALHFHVPFIVILNKEQFESANNRITSLLNVVKLEHRAITDLNQIQTDFLCKNSIDWNEVDVLLEKFKLKGKAYLDKCIMQTQKNT